MFDRRQKGSKGKLQSGMQTRAEAKRQGQKRERTQPVNPASGTNDGDKSPAAVGTHTRPPATPRSARSVPKRPGAEAFIQDRTDGKGSRPVLKLLNALLTFVVVVLLALGGAAYYLRAAVNAEGPLDAARLLVVPRNDGVQQIAERLEREGFVTDRHTFLAGLYAMRIGSVVTGDKVYNLKAGQYEIKAHTSIRGLVETLADGRSILTKVTIPEGLTSYQMVERIKGDATLSGDIKDIPAEGSLLPETYSLPHGSTRQSLIEMMQAAQKKLLEQLWAERQEGLPFKTPYEAVIMASIVERETGRNDERDRVAGVFVNRLNKRMRLQSDPTILYGLQLGKVQWGKPILQSELNSRTAHNTYVIPGLPPTPICNPGRAAIEATLKPATTGDLYFVADGHGGHVFAATNRDHNANVAKWRQIERDRATQPSGGSQPTPVPPASQTPLPATSTLNSEKAAAATKTGR